MRTTKQQVKLLALPMLLAAPLVLGACGSGGATAENGGSTSGGAAALAKAPELLCQQLNGIFSDGPDPDADPVGYALSQILPLQGVHSSDGGVQADLARLIGADQQLVTSNGADKAARAAIQRSEKAVNQACPGVAP